MKGFNEKLLGFYLGQLEDGARVEIEEQLLESKEALIEFIALKRVFEIGDLPSEPTRAFQQKLRRQAEMKFSRENRRFFKIWVPIGAFALVLLIAIGIFKMKDGRSSHPLQTGTTGVSFDSSGEASASLSVL